MINIRCCVINKKSAYRGIDRDVDMHIFSAENNKTMYEYMFEQYLQYLSTEEVYTPENSNMIFSFSDLINQYYGSSEVVLYTTLPFENKTSCYFLGIDIIDTHLKSAIKRENFFRDRLYPTNQYKLYNDPTKAEAFIRYMQKKDSRYSDLYYVYVYQVTKKDNGRFETTEK